MMTRITKVGNRHLFILLVVLGVSACVKKRDGTHFGFVFKNNKIVSWIFDEIPNYRQILSNKESATPISNGLITFARDVISVMDLGADGFPASKPTFFDVQFVNEKILLTNREKRRAELSIEVISDKKELVGNKERVLILEFNCVFFSGRYQVMNVQPNPLDMHHEHR